MLLCPVCVCVGRVCVPIDINKVESFDPFAVPTVSKICHEFEALSRNERNGVCLLHDCHLICDYVSFFISSQDNNIEVLLYLLRLLFFSVQVYFVS